MSTNATYKINYDKLGKLIIPALFATDQIPIYRPLFWSQIFRRWNLEKNLCKTSLQYEINIFLFLSKLACVHSNVQGVMITPLARLI